MKTVRWKIGLLCIAALSGAVWLSVHATPNADKLTGTWQLVTSRDLKTGTVTESKGTTWIMFTQSHWAVLGMDAGRKVIAPEEFDKLSPEEKVKANYARVWDEKGGQLFQARSGSYKLVGDKLHHTATIALQTNIIGIDRVLRIIRLDKSTLVAQTEYPDVPNLKSELTFRRLD